MYLHKASNDVAMLHDVKKCPSNKFEMKDMVEASYVIGIEIFHDRSQGFLGYQIVSTWNFFYILGST